MSFLLTIRNKFEFYALPLIIALAAVIVFLIFLLISATRSVDCDDVSSLQGLQFELDEGFQTSASYLFKVAKWRACFEPENERAQQIYPIVTDIKIKASSYALINKITFWTSLFSILVLFLVPVINSFASEKSILRKLLSPSQIPAITLLAALSFSFYDDYKNKQSSAESLIRYAVFSTDQISAISKNVIEGLSVIDTGFRFSDQMPGGN